MTEHTRTTEADTGWTDPRQQIEFSVRLANGRLAGRSFSSRQDAERWSRPEDGDQVVEFNHVCECDR